MHIHDIVGRLPASRPVDQWTQDESDSPDSLESLVPPIPSVRDCFRFPDASMRPFRWGEFVEPPLPRVGSVWAVSIFFVNSLEDIQNVCYSLHIAPGMGCNVWSFVDDAQPDRWMAVCLLGTLHAPHVRDAGVKVNQFLHVYGGLAPSVSVAAETVQLIPWYEYRRWRKQCDWALKASLWVWSAGEDMDAIEVALHAKVSKLAAGL